MIAGLLEGPYGLLIKLGATVAVVGGLFISGYIKGGNDARRNARANVVEHVLVQTRYLPGETKVLTQTVDHIVTVHDKVYVDVVKTIPDNRACDVPAASVGLLNANRGTLPAAP